MEVQILNTYLQGTVPPTFLLQQFSAIFIFCHFHILPCGLAMTAKPHGRIWKWIQNNLEISELGTRYFFKGLLIAKSKFLEHGSLSLNR